MEQFPLLRNGENVGDLTAEREGLYTRFSACACLPEGIWCVRLVGEEGELRLGVLEPQGNACVIRRRLSGQMTAPVGRLLRGEVWPVSREHVGWKAVSRPADLFRTRWIRQRLQMCRTARIRRESGRVFLALPYCEEGPFLLEALFCFAQIRSMEGKCFAVFAFDEAEQPLLCEEFAKSKGKT